MGGQLFGKLSGLNFGPILEENISIHQLIFLLANKKKRVFLSQAGHIIYDQAFFLPGHIFIGHISSKIQKNMHFFAAIQNNFFEIKKCEDSNYLKKRCVLSNSLKPSDPGPCFSKKQSAKYSADLILGFCL
ncbi:hypothetical protein BpHYR1_004002 [Brachionus plicatilis]|uniref:Uncharacterized protein n=1 Tax=Brachionus plicatilis TaxID=10195 RepID=A0A3M7T1C5_BRAPC|nr:hypothetical protein BpHYR1_004002 [Brachionus plicatilis]